MERTLDQPAELLAFLVELGAAMNTAGQPVYVVEERLTKVAGAYGAGAATITAFPTYLMVTMGRGEPAAIEMTTALTASPRLDQVASLDRLLQQADAWNLPDRGPAPARGDPRASRPRFGRCRASSGTACWRRGSVWSCIRRRSRSSPPPSSVGSSGSCARWFGDSEPCR